jgi:hypothetical protein
MNFPWLKENKSDSTILAASIAPGCGNRETGKHGYDFQVWFGDTSKCTSTKDIIQKSL